jgi:DNA-binding HxlR family transcriptional regulator
MQKYKQYCPVARASEILADRWTPLIVRELILGSHRFNEIERGLPGISRSLLASRLRDLEDAGIVERLPGAQSKAMAYHLSEAGRDLKTVIETLGAWGVRYDAAIRCRSVVVEGLPTLAKQLPQWFMWSPMARFVREREHPVAHASDIVRATERRAV